MTIAEKLTEIANNVPLVYEAGVRDGFTPPESEALTPEFVYKTTRPKDWLPMPRPGDKECYCLGQILPGKKEYFNVTLNFTGACIIEFGTVVDGVFVAQESVSPTTGTFLQKTLEYSDYGDELTDGKRQYMARIYGDCIHKINFRTTGTRVPMSNLVDIACGISVDEFNVGSYNSKYASLNRLRYLNFVGKGKTSWINGDAFTGGVCSLLSVGCEAKGVSSWAGYCCYSSRSLLSVSPNLFAGVKNGMNYAFSSTGIVDIKLGNIQPTTASYMFDACALVSYTPETVDLSKATTLNSIFRQCYSLSTVTGLNISSATDVTNMFNRCETLLRLTFAGETTPGGWTISLTDTCLDHDALVEMIDSLPVATAAATITITGVPGAAALTDAEIAVATAKNWTITR